VPLKSLPFREVKRKLEKNGFQEVSQKGSHVKFIKESANEIRTTIVPHHKEIALGTMRSILRQAGITIEEFESL
jgi:predicted RNA binding protein YcfA (HicA-like mRNA interferase family)